MQRTEAFIILKKYLSNKNLIKHCLATESTMRALARHFGEDEELWGVVGLLHDADYELSKDSPDTHGLLLFEKEKDIPDLIAHAIKSHNFQGTGILPQSLMDWAITCCDQLTGLITAAALVRPEKKLAPLTIETIMKRFKEKSFAKGADRAMIALCKEKLGIPLEEFIGITLEAMKAIHTSLEL